MKYDGNGVLISWEDDREYGQIEKAEAVTPATMQFDEDDTPRSRAERAGHANWLVKLCVGWTQADQARETLRTHGIPPDELEPIGDRIAIDSQDEVAPYTGPVMVQDEATTEPVPDEYGYTYYY